MKPVWVNGPHTTDPDISAIIAEYVLDRSVGLKPPFKVTFDPACNFCKRNRQMMLVDEEYEHPEPTFIKRLPVSVAALSYDQTYPGRSVVVLRDHVTDLNAFMKDRMLIYLAFMDDVTVTIDGINAACSPDRMNYAIYMNQNEHLHIHLIPRYKTEGEAFHGPPPFRGVNMMMPGYDYRSLAMRIRRSMKSVPSPLSHYCEKLINDGLPP